MKKIPPLENQPLKVFQPQSSLAIIFASVLLLSHNINTKGKPGHLCIDPYHSIADHNSKVRMGLEDTHTCFIVDCNAFAMQSSSIGDAVGVVAGICGCSTLYSWPVAGPILCSIPIAAIALHIACVCLVEKASAVTPAPAHASPMCVGGITPCTPTQSPSSQMRATLFLALAVVLGCSLVSAQDNNTAFATLNLYTTVNSTNATIWQTCQQQQAALNASASAIGATCTINPSCTVYNCTAQDGTTRIQVAINPCVNSYTRTITGNPTLASEFSNVSLSTWCLAC